MDDRLHRADQALAAFDPADQPRADQLVSALLERAGVIDHPPRLVADAALDYAIHRADQSNDVSGNDTDYDREHRIETAYADLSAQIIAALLTRTRYMEHTDPMNLLHRAHQAYADILAEEDL